MPKGKVKEYNPNRGCGIIINLDTGQEHAVYANYINLKESQTFEKNQEVEFEIGNNRHNSWAINVRIL